jgi:hypothetical protein
MTQERRGMFRLACHDASRSGLRFSGLLSPDVDRQALANDRVKAGAGYFSECKARRVGKMCGKSPKSCLYSTSRLANLVRGR